MPRLLPALVLLIFISACSKDNEPVPASLIGKWQQVEYYDGRTPGGCHCWSKVNGIGTYRIEFKSDGTHLVTPPAYTAMAYCIAPYGIVNDSLSLTYGCGTNPVATTHWFELKGNILTIAHEYPGASFKMKFKKVKSF